MIFNYLEKKRTNYLIVIKEVDYEGTEEVHYYSN